jgi:phosphate transport system substrate-binding protein
MKGNRHVGAVSLCRAGSLGAAAVTLVATILATGSCASGPRRGASGREAAQIRIVGSDTMEPLARRWAVEFMRRHPGISVRAEGGGSAAGIRAWIAGRADLCTSSRTLTPDETRGLRNRCGSLGIRILCARDALSIYVSQENPVSDLTIDQVAGLLSGRIVSWREVGGIDAPVTVYVREPSSGTRGFIQEQVLLDEPFAPSAIACAGTWALADAVAHDPNGIGFGGIVFGEQVRHCRIDGVAPTPARVRDGSYPFTRYLYLYTANKPRGAVEEFVDFVLSPEGQRVVVEVGYIPLLEETLAP